MNTHKDKIVADGQNRIRESESFTKRQHEIQNEMIQLRQQEIEAAGWLRRKTILWDIHRASTKAAKQELCPIEALYLQSK